MKIRFKKPDEKGVVVAMITTEVKIVPADGIWYVIRDGRTLGSWSSLEVAKRNLAIDLR